MPDFTGGDLYGRTLRLELLSFVRDEKKFPNLDALKAEISLNEKTARTLFEAFEKGVKRRKFSCENFLLFTV